MAQPYVGEIRLFAGNFAPVGWMFCDGSTLPISENEVLFQLIGTTYGGDGEESFNIPNLQSRIPVHMGTSGGVTYQLAEAAGVETVTLSVQQIPNHNHALIGSARAASQSDPAGAMLAQGPRSAMIYGAGTVDTALDASAVGPTGGSQPHENMQPFVCINYIISMFGIFPSQT